MINKVVWKYELRYYMKYKIPGFYKVVHVGEQSGRAYAWVLLNPEGAEHTYTFRGYATGEEIPQDVYLNGVHIGSVVFKIGSVWHFYLVGDE